MRRDARYSNSSPPTRGTLANVNKRRLQQQSRRLRRRRLHKFALELVLELQLESEPKFKFKSKPKPKSRQRQRQSRANGRRQQDGQLTCNWSSQNAIKMSKDGRVANNGPTTTSSILSCLELRWERNEKARAISAGRRPSGFSLAADSNRTAQTNWRRQLVSPHQLAFWQHF